MERRIVCPGSAHIDNKDTKSEYADEGTAAHEEAAGILSGKTITPKYDIKSYVDYMRSLTGKRYVETKVGITSISDEIWGTADCIVDDWPSILHIIDLKYGAGKIVEVNDNAQLATYALGALERFGEDYAEVWITIVQSRIEHKDGPIRIWKTTPAELKKNWYSKIQKAYKKAIEKPNLFKPGHHCMWCSGAFECTAAKRESKSMIKKFENDEAITNNNKKLAKLLDSEQMILEYLKKAKTEAFNRLRAGQIIPGFKLVRNFGNTTWRNKAEAEQMFRDHDDAWEDKLLAPGNLKKAYPDLVESLVHQPDKGLALVPEVDKRRAYRGAVDDFDEIEE